MAKKRVIATLALLLSLVLILPCFVGCGNAPEEKDCPEMVAYDDNFIRGPFLSYCPPKTFTLTLRKEVNFECNLIGDQFLFADEQKEQTIKSEESLLILAHSYEITNGYVTIIAKESDHIVGYAVLLIKVDFTEDSTIANGWHVSTLKAVEFPQIEGQYQDVSEEYVQRQFEKLTKR